MSILSPFATPRGPQERINQRFPSETSNLSLSILEGRIVTPKGYVAEIAVLVMKDPLTKRYMFDVDPRSDQSPLEVHRARIKPERIYIDSERFAWFEFQRAGTKLRVTQAKKRYTDDDSLIESIRSDIAEEDIEIQYFGPKSFVSHVNLVGRIDRSFFMFNPRNALAHYRAYVSAVSVGDNGQWIVLLENENGRQIRIELSKSLDVVDVIEIERLAR